MPRVPEYKKQVKIITPSISTPIVKTGQPPEAFGAGIGQAISNVGSGLSKISNALKAKEERDQKQLVLNTDTAFRKDLQDILYSNQIEEVKDKDGNITKKSVGLLNRNLNQATGISQDYDKQIVTLKNKYLKNKSKNAQQLLNNLFDNTWLNNRDNVISHEANQYEKAAQNSLNANLMLLQTEAIKNPNSNNISYILKDGKDKIKALDGGKYSKETIDLKVQTFNDGVIKNTIETLLNNNNYVQAQVILDKNEKNVSGELFSKANEQIKTVERNDKELIYNVKLFDKYGENKELADNDILNNTTLSNEDKARQLSKYNTFFNLKQNEIKNAENNEVDKLYNNAELIFKERGGRGYNETLKMIRNSNIPFDKKNSIKNVIDDIYGIGKTKKSDITTWLKVYEGVNNGEYTNIWDLMKDTQITDNLNNSDIKAFAKAMNGGSLNKFDKWSLPKNYNNIIQREELAGEDAARMYDYASGVMVDTEKKLDRNLSDVEKYNILEDSVKKITIEKQELFGIDWLKKDIQTRRYILEPTDVWDEQNQVWIRKINDNYVIIEKEDIE